jgi:hypothetical protein
MGEGERIWKTMGCTGIFSAVKRIFGENVRSHKIRNSYKGKNQVLGISANKKHPIAESDYR